MKRTLVTASIIAIVAGAAALAGEPIAIDGMSSMMLELDAEHDQEAALRQQTNFGRCADEEAALNARIESLQREYGDLAERSYDRLAAVDVEAVRRQAIASVMELKKVQFRQEAMLAEVQEVLAAHRAKVEEYRYAFRDEELLAQVQDALDAAEKALAAE